MSNFEFLLILLFFNSIILIGLVSISIKKKSPRILMKFFFLPVLASCLFGIIVQAVFQVSEISNRQLAANIFLILWCLKSFFSYKSIKSLLLADFLALVTCQISDKKYFFLLINIIRLSSFQIICFSSVFSLNYLSGFSLLSFFDNIGVILCLIGFLVEYIGNKQIKERTKVADFFIEGSRTYVLHPNITGIIFFLTGLQILAFGGVGSEWSFIGLLFAIFIIYKILLPKIEGNLFKKYPDYSSNINSMPKLFSFKKNI
jgi:steroid 5-alpha reductase family enzyme